MLIRRTNLLLPAADASRVADAWRHGADAITLDLESGDAGAHAGLRTAIAAAGKGAAEVFVRVNDGTMTTDLEAAVWPGLRGIVLRRVESAADIADAAEVITRLERERRLPDGCIEILPTIASAAGVWHVRTILAASPRISQVALDERTLAANLGIDPDPEYDAFVYARGRIVVEAVAAKVGAVGMAWPMSVQPRELDAAELQVTATKAKNLGMKGVMCPYASWVAPVNAAFTPSPELVAYNRRVREAFAAGVAAGTAAVPLDGRMIDVPVDEWAIVVLETAEACAARDAEKDAALARED